jgi:hypothetical protein
VKIYRVGWSGRAAPFGEADIGHALPENPIWINGKTPALCGAKMVSFTLTPVKTFPADAGPRQCRKCSRVIAQEGAPK